MTWKPTGSGERKREGGCFESVHRKNNVEAGSKGTLLKVLDLHRLLSLDQSGTC